MLQTAFGVEQSAQVAVAVAGLMRLTLIRAPVFVPIISIPLSSAIISLTIVPFVEASIPFLFRTI